MIYQNVLEAIGNTPLIQLSKLVPAGSARVLVKYEGQNIGGSIKTRMVRRGRVRRESGTRPACC